MIERGIDGGRLPRPDHRLRSAIFALIAILLLPCVAVGDGLARVDPTKVQAAFLRNFAHYITWPANAFDSAGSPWHVCVLGEDPFGKVLEHTFEGRKEQGRPFEILRAESVSELASCQIVFVAHQEGEAYRAMLNALARRPVLTVSDAPDFLRNGGMVRFRTSDRVEFAINLDRTNSASLVIPTKVLEVAQEVVENGVTRRHR